MSRRKEAAADFLTKLRTQSEAAAREAEAEASRREADSASARRELRRLEKLVAKGESLDEAELATLEELTKAFEGAVLPDGDASRKADDLPPTVWLMLLKLFEINSAADACFLVGLTVLIGLALTVLLIPWGSIGYVLGVPHRLAQFTAGGVPGEIFALLTLAAAYKAHRWRRIEALGWFDFGYPHWIVYLLAGAFGSFGSYMYIQAEFELRKHNHGATGLATQGMFEISRHPQYTSFPLLFGAIALLSDSVWVYVAGLATFLYLHIGLIPVEEAVLRAAHDWMHEEYVRTVPMYTHYDGGPSKFKHGGGL